MSRDDIATLHGSQLYQALRDGRTLPPLIARDPALTVDDAYAISLDFLARRRADGERVIGKKIGVTSKAVQDMLGVHQPDFGFLTDWMHVDGDIDIDAKALIAPRAEAEIAFILKAPLNGPGVTAVKGINLANEVSFAQATNGWVAGHRANHVLVKTDKRDPQTHACSNRRSFRARVAALRGYDASATGAAMTLDEAFGQ